MSVADVHAVSVRALGLDPEALDLESPEALAALVRRAASFASPCSPQALRGNVLRALSQLTDSGANAREELRTSIDETVEALTSYGDLLELPADDPNESALARVLYLAPPTYVCVDDVLFLLGGLQDGGDAVPSDLRAVVEYRSHTRRVRPNDMADASKRLRAIGWVELRRDLWLPAPIQGEPKQLIERANSALAAKPTAGEVPGLSVLDPQAPTTYYRGRWKEPTRKSGRFVARREQRYGADLWSYVELANGAVTHLTDLPLSGQTGVRPCDAAWHLQMAIDAQAGRPQFYRRRSAPLMGAVLVDFFSPVPLWARRRWDVLGEEITPSKSLFAYRFPTDVFGDVECTFTKQLWLAEIGGR
ncbi:hypothetical protein [Roseisolibacter sp. H3M3-2]|uniref:hypothetical protein n=1 Tax=Roseisolibacter sp. H3M3-2 TaxID=3031323 RepID=UPI0023DC363D|nr:hypothetical protein [Roseisolibacter sp. H3M3-2]MDF1501325.1 hypothetical protein [Roseisolibacter sp. H3M3-2]